MRMRAWLTRLTCVLLALVIALVPLVGCSKGSDGDRGAAPATTSASDDTRDESAAIPADAEDDSPTDREDAAGTPEKEQAPPAVTRSNLDSGDTSSPGQAATSSDISVSEDGTYTSPEEVALYIHTFGHLPSNFISKTKARKAGWDSKAGNLDEVCPGMSIGGSVFYNEGWEGEELLPEAPGRTWTECDVNYHGGYRGSERLVFSNDGLIFYTKDHYKTYTQLY